MKNPPSIFALVELSMEIATIEASLRELDVDMMKSLIANPPTIPDPEIRAAAASLIARMKLLLFVVEQMTELRKVYPLRPLEEIKKNFPTPP